MRRLIYIIIFIAAFSSLSIAQNQPVKVYTFTETGTGDEKFDRIFREGKELVFQEEWAKAAAKFNEIVCDCPEQKGVDAAFYWLSFCYKQQKNIKKPMKQLPDS